MEAVDSGHGLVLDAGLASIDQVDAAVLESILGVLVVSSDGEAHITIKDFPNLLQVALAGDTDHIAVSVDVVKLETKIMLKSQTLFELKDLLAVVRQRIELTEVRHSFSFTLKDNLHIF